MDLKFVFGLDHKPLTTGIEHCKGAISDFKHDASQLGELTKVGDALKLLGVSFAAFKSIEGIGEGLKSVFESGKALRSESKATGESITSLVALKKAYQEVGMDAGGLQGNLAMLQSALGGVNAEGEPTKHIFDQLGLSIDQLKGESAVDQFHAIGTAISGLATQADKMAAVKAIFGRQGAPMLNILADPKAIDDSQGVRKIIVSSIKKIDTIDIGKKIGGQVSVITAAIGQGKFSDLMQKELDVVGMYGSNVMAGIVNSFTDEFAAGAKLITATLLEAFKGPITWFQAHVEATTSLMNPENLKAAGDMRGSQADMKLGEEQLQDASKRGDNEGMKNAMALINSSRKAMEEAKNKMPESVEAIQARLMKEPTQIGTVSGIQSPDDLRKDAKARAERGRKSLMDTIAGNDPSSPNSGADISAAKNIAVAFGKSLTDAIKPVMSGEEETKPGGKHLEGWKSEKEVKQAAIKPMDADRLAKIGGFVGGGGPANDHARRTAEGISTIVTWATTIAQQGIKIMTQPSNLQGGDSYA